MPVKMPKMLLEVRDIKEDCDIPHLVCCAGYDEGKWRADPLAGNLIDWLVDWVLPQKELIDFGPYNYKTYVYKAASRVYKTTNYQNRGEVGELLIHAALRAFKRSSKIISRIYFKDAPNDTVKGFDCAHVVRGADGLELWLGEAKIYKQVERAIQNAVASIVEHLNRDYLRNEFMVIVDKCDDSLVEKVVLEKLLDETRSLDAIFERVVIPIFIAYESKVVANNIDVTVMYETELLKEIEGNVQRYRSAATKTSFPREFKVYLIFFPMASKQELLASFDERLKECQRAFRP